MSASLVCLAYLGGGSHRRYPAQALDIPAAVVSGRPGHPAVASGGGLNAFSQANAGRPLEQIPATALSPLT